MPTYYLFYVFVFLFGICCGSFLNCVIYRLETKKSFFKGRSFCPRCRRVLKWYDLIPVLSFIALRGKCRQCKKPISWQYPLVEFFTGVIFVLVLNYELRIMNYEFFNPATFFGFVFLILNSCFLILVFVYDLKHYLIPDRVIYPAIALVFLGRVFEIFKSQAGPLTVALLAGISVAAFFFLIWLVSRGKWLGFGDVKLGFLLGLFLGWPRVLAGLFLAFLCGAIIGLGLIMLGKKDLKSEIPFGPFLITGAFIALFLGRQLIQWYIGLL